ncbi:MFS transporter [Azospirillum canadense]|uniref:MFS transporter n=1 Tax=Azospirillum canadense TaxID=403962 RepID=UPI002226BB1D|nr:MFS transporter [Azospirillum canadense]MCW2239826.1 MFS family permease [Azospirillum canadense]
MSVNEECPGNNVLAGPAEAPDEGGRLLPTILIAGFASVPLGTARLILPTIALAMGAGPVFAGVMGALFTVPSMLLSVPFGRWVDRTGTLAPIVFACLLTVLGSVLFLLAPHHQALLLVACLVGVGPMFSHIAATRAVGEIGGAVDRARNLGYLVATYSLFQFVGPTLAGVALDTAGPRPAVMIIGLFAACSILGTVLPFHNFRKNVAPSRETGPCGRIIDLLRFRELRRWLAVGSVFSAVLTFVPFVVSLHAADIAISTTRAGMVLGAFSVGTVVSRLSVSLLTRHLSAPVILFGALVAGAGAYALLPVMDQFYPLLWVSLVLGATIGLGVPISLALIYAAAPPGRINESVGLCMAITNFLQTISPLALGFTVTRFGLAPMIGILALGMVGTSIIAIRGRNM